MMRKAKPTKAKRSRCSFCGMPLHRSQRTFMACVRKTVQLAIDLGEAGADEMRAVERLEREMEAPALAPSAGKS